jgi:hypothetical protein
VKLHATQFDPLIVARRGEKFDFWLPRRTMKPGNSSWQFQ